MANKIGEGWDGPGKKAFLEYTVDGQTVYAEMVAFPPGVSLAGGLTDDELRATPVPVSGTVVANPSNVTLSVATGTAANSGDNTLIAAPSAGNRLVVHDIQLQLEAATATTMLIKSGSTTKRRFYANAIGDGLFLIYPAGKEFRLGTAEALVLNLSGANSVGYTVRYTTEAA
jgi:hypothetical protein